MNPKDKHLTKEHEKKIGSTKVQTKDTPKSAKNIMGSSTRRNQVTYDLNPSPIAQNKSCKEMGKKP
jgi:hypothetical protein